jgi:hypothetical protein
MSEQIHLGTDRGIDLFSCRIERIKLDPTRLKPDRLQIFNDIRGRCPACKDPNRCAADLAAPPADQGFEDWDEYCPNAARLRILAALTMFSGDGQN